MVKNFHNFICDSIKRKQTRNKYENKNKKLKLKFLTKIFNQKQKV